MNTVPDCPGTCVHAISALFCDEILEHVPCASSIFRCCTVFNHSTEVETSPPLEETITTLAPINDISSSSNVHSFQTITNSLPNVTNSSSSTTNLYSSTTQTTPSSSLFTTIVQKITPRCSGICMENKLSKYCGNILTTDGVCDTNQFCCLQSNRTTITATVNSLSSTEPTTTDSIDLNSSNSSTSIVDTTTMTTINRSPSTGLDTVSTITANRNQTGQVSSEKKIVLNDETFKDTNETTLALENENKHNKNSDESSNQQAASDLPACDNCVTLIFSLLCDEIDNTKYCPNDGKCCKYYEPKDDSKNQANTQLTTVNPNQIGKCPGTCIPTILSGICSKPSEIIFKTTTCITGMLCCHTPMTDQNEQYNMTNDKPSLLDNSEGLTFIEPSEQTLNTKLTKFKPQPPNTVGNGYYQLVPRPNQFAAGLHQSTASPNSALISSPNWPFLNGNNHHQLQNSRIPIYKPLLSNSQMIPNSYLSNNGLSTALSNSLNNGRPNYILNNLNNFNNRSPGLFYPPSGAHSPHTSPTTVDLFNNLNVHLANSHLGSNNVLPSISTFKHLNSTSNIISHLLLSNSIPPTSCTGACMPPIFKFTCFGSNTIYPNFICNKQQQVCCASNQDIENYEATILGSLSNETNLMNNLVHNNYFGNLIHSAGNLPTNLPSNLGPNMPNMPLNLPTSNPGGLSGSNLPNSMSGLPGNLAINNNKPINSAMNTMINGNAVNKINNNNKAANKNYSSNKLQPIDRVTNKDNPLTDKFIEINQPSIPAASNVNRNRYYPPTNHNSNNKNVHKLTPINSNNNINNNNKWSSSISSDSSSGHFTPSEKPLNQKPINAERIKKPDQTIPFSPITEQNRPVLELASASTKRKLS